MTDELGLEWVKHFNRHTESRTKGAYRLLDLDGHSSHATPEIDQYCAEKKIVTVPFVYHHTHHTSSSHLTLAASLLLRQRTDMRLESSHAKESSYRQGRVHLHLPTYTHVSSLREEHTERVPSHRAYLIQSRALLNLPYCCQSPVYNRNISYRSSSLDT
jgi:hypothetical protein